jgi:hypothetical protein
MRWHTRIVRARVGLLSLTLPGVLWAAAANPPGVQTVILQPAATPPLRIDFDYNYRKALPPFAKEPLLPGRELTCGLIPTIPPTPLLRNISSNELYLNLDHKPDFVTGRLAIHRSIYNGHVLFRDLRVSTVRGALEIPYTADLYTYEHGCAGWLEVRSGWVGAFDVAGQAWRMSVVDNLDGKIGSEDVLYVRAATDGKAARLIPIGSVPQTLFLSGHAFDLAFNFKAGATGPVLEMVLAETNLPLGKLSLAAQGCRYIRLGNERMAVVLDAAAGTVSLPAGAYQITDCLLREAPPGRWEPAFISCDRKLAIKTGETASLEIGLPLQNTVRVTRDRNVLQLNYRLLGKAGEQYEYYDWKKRPRFSVYKGPVRIGGGTLPFG